MASRLLPRLYVLGAAALPRRRERPALVRRLLIVQHLLLGDTVMLTPLIKKARQRFPEAEIVMVCPRAYVPLYSGRPYGVTALPLDPYSLADQHRAGAILEEQPVPGGMGSGGRLPRPAAPLRAAAHVAAPVLAQRGGVRQPRVHSPRRGTRRDRGDRVAQVRESSK